METHGAKLTLHRETVQRLENPSEVKGDERGFLTKLGCYTPFSCPVPCY